MTNDPENRASRKVAVLGPIPRDQIVTRTGERFEKYGCARYARSLSQLSWMLATRSSRYHTSAGRTRA